MGAAVSLPTAMSFANEEKSDDKAQDARDEIASRRPVHRAKFEEWGWVMNRWQEVVILTSSLMTLKMFFLVECLLFKCIHKMSIVET